MIHLVKFLITFKALFYKAFLYMPAGVPSRIVARFDENCNFQSFSFQEIFLQFRNSDISCRISLVRTQNRKSELLKKIFKFCFFSACTNLT